MKEKGGNFRPLAQENRKQIEGEKEKKTMVKSGHGTCREACKLQRKMSLCLVV
jgi:hypothetical protein